MSPKKLVVYITDIYSRPLNKFFLKSYLMVDNDKYDFLEYDDVCCKKEAGLLINKFIEDLPENSIIFSLVREKIDNKNPLIYVKIKNKHIFLPNNGVLGYIYAYMETEKKEIYEINPDLLNGTVKLWNTFLLLVQAVENNRITEISKKIENVKILRITKPQQQIASFTSRVLFFNKAGSAVLDLTEKMFREKAKNYNSYRMVVKEGLLELKKVDVFISENKEVGEPYAIFNEYGHLEIGIYMESIQKMYSLTDKSVVKIEFYE
jgi:S-adenosylmethionine hydrolase